MPFHTADNEDLSQYAVQSRREIVNLLRSIGAHNQLVRMQANNGADSVVTSILEVDEARNLVIIDRAPGATTNQRILDSEDIAFDTVLENIRILFSAQTVQSCVHDGRPALCIALPASLVRLQRREFYRVATPISNPVRCMMLIQQEDDHGPLSVGLPLFNISAGGIGVTDEKNAVPKIIGTTYDKCRLDLPGGAVDVGLRLMNAREVALATGKSSRRLGFMFGNLSNQTPASIQRYITKLEREQNARATGMS